MKTETRERLIQQAKAYTVDELQRFIDEVGWEEWMEEFTNAADGEEISEREAREIDKVLYEIFEEAHAPERWYAVQEDETDAWDYGSYDYKKAVELLMRQGHGLIAVIINDDSGSPVCIDELMYEDIIEEAQDHE